MIIVYVVSLKGCYSREPFQQLSFFPITTSLLSIALPRVDAQTVLLALEEHSYVLVAVLKRVCPFALCVSVRVIPMIDLAIRPGAAAFSLSPAIPQITLVVVTVWPNELPKSITGSVDKASSISSPYCTFVQLVICCFNDWLRRFSVDLLDLVVWLSEPRSDRGVRQLFREDNLMRGQIDSLQI